MSAPTGIDGYVVAMTTGATFLGVAAGSALVVGRWPWAMAYLVVASLFVLRAAGWGNESERAKRLEP